MTSASPWFRVLRGSLALGALSLGALSLGLGAACGGREADPEVPPRATSDATSAPTQTATAAPSSTGVTMGASSSEPDKPGLRACKLPAPVKSQDRCSTDADCAPSDPCHAKACVAKAKAAPPSGKMCTRDLQCDTADVNKCGCFEGFCALTPPP
jgi:hypothetical protein